MMDSPLLNLQSETINAYEDLRTMTPIRDPHLQRMTQRTWLGRMVNEYGSSDVFHHFAAQCHRADMPAEDIKRLKEFALEEKRHGVLCGTVVEHFGGQAIAPSLQQPEFPLHTEVSALEGVLRNLLSICCLSETVAVALIAAEREDMPESPLKNLLTEIWSDECGHAHFGWRKLQEWLPNNPKLKANLTEYLCIAFGHLEAHELAHLPLESNPPEEGAQYGLCSGATARALFYATVEGIIVPNLQQYGIDADWAWKNREHP
jgi:hypothetical protein